MANYSTNVILLGYKEKDGIAMRIEKVNIAIDAPDLITMSIKEFKSYLRKSAKTN